MDGDSRRAKAAELVEKYGSALFRLCLVMLRNAPDAEDAVQDALLRLYRAARRNLRTPGRRARLALHRRRKPLPGLAAGGEAAPARFHGRA